MLLFSFVSDLFASSSSELDEASFYSNSDIDPDYVVQSDSTDSNSDENDMPDVQVVPSCSERTPGKHTVIRKEKISRKQAKSPETWNENIMKKRRNSGEAYVTKKGKNIPEKTMNALEGHNCRIRCNEKISLEQRHEIFDSFWGLSDYNAQNAFIIGSVELKTIKRKRHRKNPDVSRREKTRVYKLNIDTVVCKQFYLSTLGISNGRVNRIMGKQCLSEGNVPTPDQRGKHKNHKKHDPAVTDDVKNHINSFPAYASHYCREKNSDSKKYLSPDLTVSKMYGLYVDLQKSQGKEFLKESAYRHIFDYQFNLSFHTPRQDTCKTCDALIIKIKAETDVEKIKKLKDELQLHHRVAEQSREFMKKDSQEAKTYIGNEKEVFTFDLEKTLPTPRIPTGNCFIFPFRKIIMKQLKRCRKYNFFCKYIENQEQKIFKKFF